MRLFIAIDIPEDIKVYLREIQNQIPEEKMRLTSDVHLTLKFLGSVDENKKQEVEEALQGIPFQPFEAELTEIGLFLFRGNPCVVWIGIKVPGWLFQSQREIEERLAPLGFEPENRFTPHLTLARIKSVNNPKSFETAIKRIRLEKKKFPVNHFYLFQSHLSKKGATYEKLTEFSGATQ